MQSNGFAQNKTLIKNIKSPPVSTLLRSAKLAALTVPLVKGDSRSR